MCVNVTFSDDPLRHRAAYHSCDNKTISVTYNRQQAGSATLDFRLISSDRSESGLYGSVLISSEHRELLATLSIRLEELFSNFVQQGNPSETKTKNTLMNIQALSKKMFNRLIPQRLADQARNWDQGVCIEIMTNEHWVPWELLHDGQSFWGAKFILSRVTTSSFGSQRLKENTAVRTVFNIVGGGLKQDVETLATEMFQDSAVLKVKLISACSASEVVETLKNQHVDILHLTCHGHRDPLRLTTSNLNDGLEMHLSVEVVEEELEMQSSGFIFANACNSSARFVGLFNEDTNFGKAFCERGARAFVGTLGPVPSRHAVNLACDFYKLFLQSKPETLPGTGNQFSLSRTVGFNLLESKRSAAKNQNMFWLFYCLHGDLFHIF
jgi:hypothetical protein